MWRHIKPADTNRSRAFPIALSLNFSVFFFIEAGVYGKEVPPVPIPNTEVKLFRVDDTWLATTWETISMPAYLKMTRFIQNRVIIYSSIAQSVERMTVNHDVTGSSPVGGARCTISSVGRATDS